MNTMTIEAAYQTAVKQLANTPEAAAVTVEFYAKTTGLTKYMTVRRDNHIEISDAA